MGILQLVAFLRLLCHRFEVDPNDLGEMDSCHCRACRAGGKRRAAGTDRRAGLELAGATGRNRRQSLWRSDLADRARSIEAAAARQTQAAETACACQAGPAKAGSSCQGSKAGSSCQGNKAATSEAGAGRPAAEYPAATRASALTQASRCHRKKDRCGSEYRRIASLQGKGHFNCGDLPGRDKKNLPNLTMTRMALMSFVINRDARGTMDVPLIANSDFGQAGLGS
jgi:hypothetical protein